jgi:hypothetical protein
MTQCPLLDGGFGEPNAANCVAVGVTSVHVTSDGDEPLPEDPPDPDPPVPVPVPPPLADPPGSWAVTVHPAWPDEQEAPTPP